MKKKIKVSKAVSQFIESFNTIKTPSEEYRGVEDSYYYIPFWFKKINDREYEAQGFDELDKALKVEIIKERNALSDGKE